MSEFRLGEIEAQFADLIWDNQPLSSGTLAALAGESLGWKRTTTYTVLKRLCDKGLFQNLSGTVSALMSKEEYMSAQSEKFVADTFGGSLPAFLAAFSKRKKLSETEIAEIREMIQKMGEE